MTTLGLILFIVYGSGILPSWIIITREFLKDESESEGEAAGYGFIFALVWPIFTACWLIGRFFGFAGKQMKRGL
jgi:hypothetical protein